MGCSNVATGKCGDAYVSICSGIQLYNKDSERK